MVYSFKELAIKSVGNTVLIETDKNTFKPVSISKLVVKLIQPC